MRVCMTITIIMFLFMITMKIIRESVQVEMAPYMYKREMNSTKSISKHGVICTHGAAGRLNNIIIHERSVLFLAWKLKRTLVVSKEVSTYFDVVGMGLNMFPNEEYLPMVPYNSNLCYSDGNVDENVVLTIGKQVPRVVGNTTLQLEKLIDIIGDKRRVVVSGWDFFYKYPSPPSYFYNSFMRHSIIRPDLYEVASKFVTRVFGDNPFVAVHLRDLEGACNSEMCNPTFDTTMRRMRTILPKKYWDIPIFVASDGQRPEVENTYRNAQGKAFFFDGNCIGTSCAIIDFEICSRSNLFFGTSSSTTDLNIALWRSNHNGSRGMMFKSIIRETDLP